MNILLVAINAKYIHSNPAVFSLKSCAGEYEPYVKVLEFTINQQASYILREIYKSHPDVVAFSCYIWNRSMIGEVICDLHKIMPDIDVWAGGPEVSYDAFKVIEEWKLRGVMVGPGEGSFYHMIFSYANGTESELPSVLDGNRAFKMTLDEIPFWYKDLKDFEHRIIYYESSRGCPFSCSYCLSSIDKTMDFRSVERVCAELDFFLKNNVPQVKFVDRTFNCKKDHAIPILRYILENDNNVTNFHFEIAADLLDEEYLFLLRQMRPGAVQLEIGVQSMNLETIEEIRRKMDFRKVSEIVTEISSWNNIHIHLDLIAGLPFEDIQKFRKSFNDVYELYPEQLQLGFLKVLKGSSMAINAPAYHLVYTSLPPYEVLSTKWMSYEDICHLKKIEEVLEIYYNSGQFRYSMSFLNLFFDTPFDLYDSLASWYEEHDLFGVQPSRVRKYEILLEFGRVCIDKNGGEYRSSFYKINGSINFQVNEGLVMISKNNIVDRRTAMLREYIAYDLYLREHMKNRPSFLFSLESYKDMIHDILHRESESHELLPQLGGCTYRDLIKMLHVEVFEFIFDKPVSVIFSYDRRDPLTNNCMVIEI